MIPNQYGRSTSWWLVDGGCRWWFAFGLLALGVGSWDFPYAGVKLARTNADTVRRIALDPRFPKHTTTGLPAAAGRSCRHGRDCRRRADRLRHRVRVCDGRAEADRRRRGPGWTGKCGAKRRPAAAGAGAVVPRRGGGAWPARRPAGVRDVGQGRDGGGGAAAAAEDSRHRGVREPDRRRTRGREGVAARAGGARGSRTRRARADAEAGAPGDRSRRRNRDAAPRRACPRSVSRLPWTGDGRGATWRRLLRALAGEAGAAGR